MSLFKLRNEKNNELLNINHIALKAEQGKLVLQHQFMFLSCLPFQINLRFLCPFVRSLCTKHITAVISLNLTLQILNQAVFNIVLGLNSENTKIENLIIPFYCPG